MVNLAHPLVGAMMVLFGAASFADSVFAEQSADPADTVAIVKFTTGAKDVGPFAGCDDPDAICIGGVREGSVLVERQLSGRKLPKKIKLRFSSLEGYAFPKGFRLLIEIDQSISDDGFYVAPFWIRPDKRGRFCVTEKWLGNWEDGTLRREFAAGRKSRIDGSSAKCLRD